ncbi:NUDIX hydrolase [Corynebacterium sp. 335C]
MATPEFILALRERIGHAELWLQGVTCAVWRDAPDAPGGSEWLLARRADNGTWAPVCGIVEPGEEPDVTAARECAEEAGVAVDVVKLLWVRHHGLVEYANGDRARYLDNAYLARLAPGEGREPRCADGENTDIGWFAAGELPPMKERFAELLAHAAEVVAGGEDAIATAPVLHGVEGRRR